MYENRKYVIFNTSETGSIDFSQVTETSVITLRLNLSGSQTFVKYEGSQPSSVAGLSSKSNEFIIETMYVDFIIASIIIKAKLKTIFYIF